MPKIWKPTNPETLKYYLITILDEASDELTEWESNFVNDISIRLFSGGGLSQKQEEVLEKIYVRVTK